MVRPAATRCTDLGWLTLKRWPVEQMDPAGSRTEAPSERRPDPARRPRGEARLPIGQLEDALRLTPAVDLGERVGGHEQDERDPRAGVSGRRRSTVSTV